jgi:hypothetical protein
MVRSFTICYVKRFSKLSDIFYIFCLFTPGKQPYFEISEMTTHGNPRPRSLMNFRLR